MKKNLGVAGELFPQSVFIVASYGEDGTPNAMNVAWGGECTRTQVAINIGDHKTTDNILARGAFTVAPADAAHVAEADYFGIATGRRVNKAEGSGLTFTRSEFVDAPVIEEFPLTMECRVVSVEDWAGEKRFVGEIVNTRVDEAVPVSMTGKDVRIALNCKFVSDCLKAAGDDAVRFSFNGPVAPCLVTPLQGERYLYLILPVRTTG